MGAKILVVDDEPFILKMVACRLNSNGYDVVTANNGEDALKRVEDQLPDLLLVDIMMPPPDGTVVAKTLKANPKYKHIPIILLTAKSGGSEIEHAMECGADSYLIKPYNADVLLSKIRGFLNES